LIIREKPVNLNRREAGILFMKKTSVALLTRLIERIAARNFRIEFDFDRRAVYY
jgi:hypothetical protein